MKVVGITGHQQIPPNAMNFIIEKMRRVIEELSEPVLGVTSLAEGADQIFARTVLSLGGLLHVVVPSEGYEKTFSKTASGEFRDLLSRAEKVEVLPHNSPSEEAYLKAGMRVVELADILLAVWDGQTSHGRGGTADVVAHARTVGKPVVIIWPSGVSRS